MLQLRWFGTIAVACSLLAACGGGGDGGGGPTPTPATVQVAISPTDPALSFGDTRTLTATVRDASGNVLPNAAVTWTVDNSVASLNSSSGASVTATASANGTATITARSGSASGTTTFVVAQRLSTIVVSPSAITLPSGSSRQIETVARDARGNTIASPGTPTFASSDNSKATVSTTGLITAVADGSATITTTLVRGGVTATATTSVTVAPFATSATVVAGNNSDEFTPAIVDIALGGTVTWTFGARAHNVIFSPTPGAPANIPSTVNSSVPRTFGTAGNFNYDCNIHPGMTGRVVVH